MNRQARLRVVRRPTRFFSIMPTLRLIALWSLVGALLVGAFQWFQGAQSAGALAFTPHTVSVAHDPGAKDVQGRDVNADGAVDLVTAGTDGVKIYENIGAWQWTRHVVDDKRAERVLMADVDRDQDVDLIVSMSGDSPSIRWYENRGDFEFTSHALSTAGSDAIVAVGDLNGDGWVDLASASGDETKILERWMNNGDQTFTATTVSADSKVTAIAIGGVSRSGYGDIVTGGEAGLQRWSTNDGTTWTRSDIDDSNENRSYLAITDAPNTSMWIATADTSDDETMLYRSGTARSTTASHFGKKAIDEELDAKTVAIADLDGDGDLDLLVAAQENNEVYWFTNDGLDEFTRHTVATGLQNVFSAAAVDVDRDGDLDILTSDPEQGIVLVYERLRKKPTATAPTGMAQSADGRGQVTFTTTLADDDGEPTRARIQYSLDGEHWYKPWLVKAEVATGIVDLENRQGYQVGTRNAIDTNQADSVQLTLTWDTKSSENTGGPIIGDIADVRLRVLPRDDRDIGLPATSAKFRVDNAPPQGGTLKIDSMGAEEASLSWTKPADSSGVSYQLYYGTNRAEVLDKKSSLWEGTDDAPLSDIDTTSTTVTELQKDTLYTFKLFSTDEFGNVSGPASVSGTTAAVSSSPIPTISTTPEPGGSTPTPTPGGATVTPTAEPTVTLLPTSTPTPSPTTPTVLAANTAPVADAGPEQVVNPRALVILNGTASYDIDPGDSSTLTYTWRQISGPTVDFLSERTATPSFSAGDENETYIFLLTVRDVQGASAIDTVTIATKALPQSPAIAVEIEPNESAAPASPAIAAAPSPLSAVLLAIDLFLLGLSLISTAILLLDRLSHLVRARVGATAGTGLASVRDERAQSRVVHYKTGAPIAGATVLVYGDDGKLRAQERTNSQGAFASFFPPGVYTLGVRMDGFALAPAAAKAIAPADSIMYAGGKVTVKDANHPPSIIIPLKPMAGEVTTLRVRLLHAWQSIQYLGRVMSWPLFFTGAILNTALVFWQPSLLYLVIEVVYIVLVIVKIAVEIRLRPAYGLVRDAITHVPLELAVVRLLEQGTNRLVMTRVTNNQGKFFALPPAGTYTITISKPGYGTFTKDGVEIVSDHDTTLQMMADLMPVSPAGAAGGLLRARAATM